ncbi:MAG: hypothetical protein Q8P41_28270 [Pseudomonadota bacterium]|nr:hypothetical protein [Pseudomonadota bacterium]
MWFLLALPATAALPWDCVEVAVPADARPYVEGYELLEETAATALAAVVAYADDTCVAAACADGTAECEEYACTTAAGAALDWRRERRDARWYVTTATVEADGLSASVVSDAYLEEYEAYWTGELVSGWPVDGWYVASGQTYVDYLGEHGVPRGLGGPGLRVGPPAL